MYHKVATNFYTAIQVLDLSSATFDPVTGLVVGDFSIRISKNNATVATPSTGLTFNEVSAANNPGEYGFLWSGSTGFPAATGAYELVIERTSTGQTWTGDVIVTNDGTGAGTLGTASFTATAGDGRILSGGVALQDATIRIVHPTSGLVWASLTSSVTGVWGPVYFPDNGVYACTVQKSGYSIGSFSITVAAGTATGPGADISLTATAASSSALTFSALKAYAIRQMLDRSGAKAVVESGQAVNEAIRMVAMEKHWPWLTAVGRVNLYAAYATGSVTMTSGDATVTLAGGTFPSWAASAEILVENQWCPVATRTSDAEVELSSAWLGTTGTYSYTIVQWKYALPSDCMRIVKMSTRTNWYTNPRICSRAEIEMARYNYVQSSDQPFLICPEGSNLCVWPLMSADAPINILYIKMPATLVGDTEVADWDVNQLSMLYRAIDYMVATRGECAAGNRQQCLGAYQEACARGKEWDRDDSSNDTGLRLGLEDNIINTGYNVT